MLPAGVQESDASFAVIAFCCVPLTEGELFENERLDLNGSIGRDGVSV